VALQNTDSQEAATTRVTALPTTPKGRRTWANILAAARRVVARDGYTGARMSDVAAEAALSMGGLYRYFDNKTSLFKALVGDIHEELYEASRPHGSSFADQPFAALLEANVGYLRHYYENRDVMRAFIEAANIDVQFRELWWDMRRRHVERYVRALDEHHGVTDVSGVDVVVAADAMACMVEQCAYVWYAHEAMPGPSAPVETAGWIVTRAWFGMFFGQHTEGELTADEAEALLATLPDSAGPAERR
jgi:AcrR family transcriptional regulator